MKAREEMEHLVIPGMVGQKKKKKKRNRRKEREKMFLLNRLTKRLGVGRRVSGKCTERENIKMWGS